MLREYVDTLERVVQAVKQRRQEAFTPVDNSLNPVKEIVSVSVAHAVAPLVQPAFGR
jgi:hypothetical protein